MVYILMRWYSITEVEEVCMLIVDTMNLHTINQDTIHNEFRYNIYTKKRKIHQVKGKKFPNQSQKLMRY